MKYNVYNPADPSLALYLPLHQLDGTTFMSRDHYGHLCTVTGAVWTPQGRWFDHIDDQIITPLDVPPTAFTLEVWLNSPFTASADNNRAILGKRLAVVEWSLLVAPSIRKAIFQGWDAAGTQVIVLTSNTAMVANTWNYVGLTYDLATKTSTFYLNGVAAGTVSGADDIIRDTAEPVRIGNADNDPDRYWDGYISEVRIYSRVLTLAEIQQNYQSTKFRYQ